MKFWFFARNLRQFIKKLSPLAKYEMRKRCSLKCAGHTLHTFHFFIFRIRFTVFHDKCVAGLKNVCHFNKKLPVGAKQSEIWNVENALCEMRQTYSTHFFIFCDGFTMFHDKRVAGLTHFSPFSWNFDSLQETFNVHQNPATLREMTWNMTCDKDTQWNALDILNALFAFSYFTVVSW